MTSSTKSVPESSARASNKDKDIEAGLSAAQSEQDVEEKRDTPTVVAWDGPSDPENPLNWPSWQRTMHVVLVGIFSLYANLAATMFAPGAAALVQEFHISDKTLASFTVTIYILGFCFGPLFIAPLSEMYGRLMLYHICNAIYIGFTVGCALSTNTAMFFVFRFICGCAASAPMTIGGGTVADVVPPEKRGKAMAIFACGPLLGPVIGPIIGGFVSQSIGWRWTFWLMVIVSATVSIIALIFMRETYAPILLKRKAERLHLATGREYTVSNVPPTKNPGQVLLRAILRPTKLLIYSPIVLLLSLFCAVVFSMIFILFTTFPAVFGAQYGFGPGVSGLSYLGLGIGMIIGLGLFAKLSDRVAKKQAADAAPKPEGRLPLMIWFSPIIPIGFFWYGWSAQTQVHWIVPIIGTGLVGLGALFIIMPAQIYLVDAFGPQAAASALAANLITRCLFGAFLPMAAPIMYDRLGLGWGNSVLGFICLAFAPVPVLFYRYGEKLRERFVFAL